MSKKSAGPLVVDCPHCGEVGEVSWSRLGKVFACKACGGRFAIGADGKAVEVTVTAEGTWVETGKVRVQARRRQKRRLIIAGAVVAAALIPALGFTGWSIVHAPADQAAEVELPQDLEARAELFGRGWLTNDVRPASCLTAPLPR